MVPLLPRYHCLNTLLSPAIPAVTSISLSLASATPDACSPQHRRRHQKSASESQVFADASSYLKAPRYPPATVAAPPSVAAVDPPSAVEI